MKERDIQFEIREALGLEPGLVLYRNSVGVAREWDPKTHTQRVIRYGLAPGSADLIGSFYGRFVGLEVKRPGEYPTKEQRMWADLLRNNGAYVVTVRSIEDAKAAIEELKRGAK